MHFRRTTWLNSLSLKILLAYVTGAVLTISLLVIFSTIAKDRLPGMGLPERTAQLAGKLRFDSEGNPNGFTADHGQPSWLYESLSNETAYRVLDESGRVVLISPGAARWPDSGTVSDPQRRRFQFQGDGVAYEAATESVEKNGRIWFVQLAVSSRLIDFLHDEFAVPFIRLGVIVFSLLLLLVFGLCTYVILTYSLRPLRGASRGAARISPQSLSERLDEKGAPAEILPLINSFNQALGRLEKGYRTQQEFLAKAAHELKTPLTLIRAEVELMDGAADAHESLLAQVEHLTRHVQQLLLLAEASEPIGYQFSDVDLPELVEDTVFYLRKIAADAGVNLRVHPPGESVHWRADQGALFTLLKNLIENAVQHAPAGTSISIYISADRLRVRDWGPGVAPEHLPLLFSRFWRGDHRRDHGAGLGLSICQEICVTHRWTLRAGNANPGLALEVARPD